VDYYKILQLTREPFANTPDPDMFYPANQHAHCLQKLEVAVRLRRGLCVVTGEVGTGKTTVCRYLYRYLSGDDLFCTHLILDPCFENSSDFAARLNQELNGREDFLGCSSQCQHKEKIQDFLLRLGMEEGRIVTLIIDEGQKLPADCLEFLRELLNFDTDEHKLLQIIIFAQDEFLEALKQMSNLQDRVALNYRLAPLSSKDTVNFLLHRIQASSTDPSRPPAVSFSLAARRLIYRLTKGYPRRIIHLGHNILLTLVILGRTRVTRRVVSRAAENVSSRELPHRSSRPLVLAAGAVAVLLALGFMYQAGHLEQAKSRWLAFIASHYDAGDPPVSQDRSRYRAPVPPVPDNSIDRQDRPVPAYSLPEKNSHDNARQPVSTLDTAADRNILGKVTVISRENLWTLVDAVYGESSVRGVQAVTEANPWLASPDIIHAGQKITLPVTSLDTPAPEQRVWIRLAWARDLDQAYQQAYNAGLDSFRVLALYDAGAGFAYWVVHRESFDDVSSARQALDNKARAWLQEAEIVSLEDSDRAWKLAGLE